MVYSTLKITCQGASPKVLWRTMVSAERVHVLLKLVKDPRY